MQTGQKSTELASFSADATDVKLAQFLIETPSATDQELADKLGVCRQTVNKRKNSSAVQQIVRDTLKISEREMRRLTTKALARLEALLDHEDPRIKLAATVALVKLNERFIGNNFSLGGW
jgi:N12 class adenine-specific DNA methylase